MCACAPASYFTDEVTHLQKCNNYIGWTFQWIRAFRTGAIDLPWGEDWIWCALLCAVLPSRTPTTTILRF